MLKYEGTDKIRDIKYEDSYVDKIYYDNNTQLVFTSDKEKTGVDEVQFKGRKLIDVTSYGKCEQSGTPTPDAPMDIVSNNGVLKVRHQSGLPWDYTLLEYIQSTGTQYIDTGINGSQITRFVVKGTCAPNGSSNSQLLGGTNASALRFFGARVISGVINWYCVDGTKSLGDPTHLSIIDCAIESTSSQPGTLTDTTTGTTQAFTKLADNNWGFDSRNLLLFGGDATRRSTNATCCYLKLYTSSGLVFDGVPCKRDSDNVAGMYDLVSGQFFTNQGTGDFVAGATVDDIEVYADGTVETIKDSLNNTATAEMLLKVGNYQDVQEILSGAITRNVGVKVFNGTENIRVISTENNNYIKPDATDGYFIASNGKSSSGIGYSNQYALSTRTIWSQFGYPNKFALNPINTGGIQIHLNTANEILGITDYTAETVQSATKKIKAFLARQYAAGTPVIIVYPISSPVTEQVAPQALNVQTGDNILEITQASVDDIQLKVKYK